MSVALSHTVGSLARGQKNYRQVREDSVPLIGKIEVALTVEEFD